GSSHLEIAEKKDIGSFRLPSEVVPGLRDVLDRILAKMLARLPQDRYQTASDLIVELERSKLSAALPSFTDRELALRDPIVLARLATPSEPTRMNLNEPAQKKSSTDPADPNTWYLRYKNREGRWCKTRVTTQQVLQR